MTKMLQVIQWKYSGDPRGVQYSEHLKEFCHEMILNDKTRTRPELKNILMFLANEYKKNVNDDKMLSVIMTDINEYYKFLLNAERSEFQKLIGKMETQNEKV